MVIKKNMQLRQVAKGSNTWKTEATCPKTKHLSSGGSRNPVSDLSPKKENFPLKKCYTNTNNANFNMLFTTLAVYSAMLNPSFHTLFPILIPASHRIHLQLCPKLLVNYLCLDTWKAQCSLMIVQVHLTHWRLINELKPGRSATVPWLPRHPPPESIISINSSLMGS